VICRADRGGARIAVPHPAKPSAGVLDNRDENAIGASTIGRAQEQDRLDSWKRIAAYLRRDVTTVQRWERREAMPVHRHLHDRQGSVFAFRSELDRWWVSRGQRLTLEAQGDSAPAQPTSAAAPATATVTPSPVPSGPARRWLWLGAAALITLLAAALVWLAQRSEYLWRSPLAEARFVPLDFTGTEQAAAISRDGRRVVFLATREGQIDAWVHEVGTGDYRNLTHGQARDVVNPVLRVLSFSPDASLVSIWTKEASGLNPGAAGIVAVPSAGDGPPRQYLRPAAEYDWSHDGTRLVYHTTAPGDPLFLHEGSAPPGRPDRRIYAAPTGVHCHFPLWSPDDAYIYFARGVPPDTWDIWRIRPSGAGLERITRHNTRVTYPVMLDGRTLLYLATDADGSGPWLFAVDVERRRSHRISFGVESYTSLGGSVDGRRLVATIGNAHSSLWRLQLGQEHGAAVPEGGATLLSASGSTPRLGSDFLLYTASLGGRDAIWLRSHGASRAIWSSPHASVVGAPALAPDGRHLAFSVAENDKTRLYAMERDGTHLRLLSDSLVLRGNPSWTPDGTGVVLAAVHEGEPRLMRFFLNGDAPLLLVSEYSLDAVWSPDGRFLIYSGPDVGTNIQLRAAGADGRPFPLPGILLPRGARRVAFLRDAQTLIVLGGELGHKDFWLIDLASGARRVLAEMPEDFDVRDFDVAASGSQIVFDRVQAHSQLVLIERGP
jgi:Tol biopolymer transport system component